MIYKFAYKNLPSEMEVEHARHETGELEDVILFSIRENSESECIIHPLTKSEVFKLIGALHLLHKEMK